MGIHKSWIIIVAIVLVAFVLFMGVYLGPFFMGRATLRVGFQPEPPWQIKLGEFLNFTFYVANDGPGIARDISVYLLMPSGFIDSDTSTNGSNFSFSRISPGHGRTWDFRVYVSNQATFGNHTFTIRVTCANAPEQLINPEIQVS